MEYAGEDLQANIGTIALMNVSVGINHNSA